MVEDALRDGRGRQGLDVPVEELEGVGDVEGNVGEVEALRVRDRRLIEIGPDDGT
jgi:hypothetical protein